MTKRLKEIAISLLIYLAELFDAALKTAIGIFLFVLAYWIAGRFAS